MWFAFLSLLACEGSIPALPRAAPEPVSAPETHSWKEEGQLVVDGLEQVKKLYREEQRDAARVLAERVYSERFEPRLEPALARMKGESERARVEYSFGQLLLALEGRGKKAIDLIATLQATATAIAADAQRAIPAPGEATAPVVTAKPEDLKPIVPDVKPNWEKGIEAKPVAIPR